MIALAACDRVLGLERPCDEALFASACSTCGGVGQACCAGATTCGEGLFCGDGTCSECVTDASPGRRHMCSLRYDGTVWCSGKNNRGQLGQPPNQDRTPVPVQVMGAGGQPLTGITAIGAGREHTCALRADTGVVCWGHDMQGQLGDGGVAQDAVPVPVEVIGVDNAPLTNITQVFGGAFHSCALDRAAQVWCWGNNPYGQLGDGSYAERPRAVRVRKAGGLEVLTDVVELAVGHDHNCARTGANQAWCWGRNDDGAIGNGSAEHQPLAVRVRADATTLLENVVSIGAGSFFSCAALLDGTAKCWGAGWRDRLGNGVDDTPVNHDVPTDVVERPDGPAFQEVAKVAVGSVGCVVTRDTAVWCWGRDQYGTTGGRGGSTVPSPVFLGDEVQLTGVDRLVSHYAHNCAHLTSGRFVCWGRNTGGELASGTIAHTGTPADIQLTCP